MAHDCTITQQLLQRQQDMFLEAANRGHTQKAIHYATKLSLSVIGQYARGETALSGPSIMKLQKTLGEQLISMLFDDNLQLVDAPAEMNHDAVVQAAHDYMTAKSAAHHPDSPGGRDIAPCEDAALREKGAKLSAVTA